jgi:hypothetical protein
MGEYGVLAGNSAEVAPWIRRGTIYAIDTGIGDPYAGAGGILIALEPKFCFVFG